MATEKQVVYLKSLRDQWQNDLSRDIENFNFDSLSAVLGNLRTADVIANYNDLDFDEQEQVQQAFYHNLLGQIFLSDEQINSMDDDLASMVINSYKSRYGGLNQLICLRHYAESGEHIQYPSAVSDEFLRNWIQNHKQN